MRSPANCAPNFAPASRRWISASVSCRDRPMAIGGAIDGFIMNHDYCAIAVACTSSSHISAPRPPRRGMPQIVFSGWVPLEPRCAMLSIATSATVERHRLKPVPH